MSKLFAKLCCWSSAADQPDALGNSRPATARGRRRAAQQQQQHNTSSSSSFHQQAREISQIQVAGSGIIRHRAAPGTSSYYHNHEARPPSSPRSLAAASTIAPTNDDRRASRQTDTTLVATTEGGGGGGLGEDAWKKNTTGYNETTSMWKGKPNGTEYDRRQELTEEDEDMWARLAM